MHSLCENETFPCEESVLRHDKRNCFPCFPDLYLTAVNAQSFKHE